jgi:general stress protein 26
MARWSQLAEDVPGLAERAKAMLDAHVHKTIATLRRDGSPRISGTEARFHAGDLWFGSMPSAVKALDLRRDPRFALHSGSEDPPGWSGDAKVAGLAEEVTDRSTVEAVMKGAWENESPEGEMHLFRADITELVVVGLNAERSKMVIESWHPARGVEHRER